MRERQEQPKRHVFPDDGLLHQDGRVWIRGDSQILQTILCVATEREWRMMDCHQRQAMILMTLAFNTYNVLEKTRYIVH